MKEADLLKVYEKLNKEYFQGSIFVSQIKFVRFLVDAVRSGVTFGEFRYEGGSNSQIYLNKYMLLPPILKTFPWTAEVVLYHEMCHAMLVLNKFPKRYGKYTCLDHGTDFWELMLRHPKAKEFDHIQTKMGHLMRQTFEREANSYLLRHPKEAAMLLDIWRKGGR